MKKTQKIIMMFLVAMLTIVAIPTSVFAEENDNTLVYVNVPADWESPCLWAWADDGTNAFEAWPGGELEADENNEGWYYTFVPSVCTNIIVNANEGEIQTAEQKTEGKNVWVTITDKDNVDISYDQKTEGDIPQYVEKFTIHAKVPDSWESVNLWAWNKEGTNAFDAWPGEAMSADDTGWYTAKAPVWVELIIVNGNEGSVQTEDIKIDPAEIWVTVADDNSFEISYDDPDKAEVADVTVYAKVPDDWEGPNLWAWSAPDGTNVFTTWPGEPLDEADDGWYSKTIPGWVNSIIVNANEGSVQTTDVSVETGKDVWLVVNGAEEFEVTYEKPEATAEVTQSDDTTTLEETEPVDVETEDEDSNTSTVVTIVVISVVVVAGIIIAIVLNNKKKKNV